MVMDIPFLKARKKAVLYYIFVALRPTNGQLFEVMGDTGTGVSHRRSIEEYFLIILFSFHSAT